MKKTLLLLLLAVQLVQFSTAQNQTSMKSAGNKSNLVKTANGVVEGTLEQSGVRSFKGIPFAAPPVGDLRWKTPQPVRNWKGVRKANQFGAHGMQFAAFGDMGFRTSGMSEDCLYLNVWSPAAKSKKLLPVLVYFYGGGFVAGDGSEARYDGESMATKGIVSVTVNYRLGVFGFLAHPELTKESPHQSSGNYGLFDQNAALLWVQKNIAAFGGDPKRVTIAGESAGSVSVSAQMASPLSKNLIAGAIGESGSLLGTLPAAPLAKGEQVGVEFAGRVGAKSLAELRAMPAKQLLDSATKFGPFRFSMTVDGYFFPKNPLEIFQAGEQAKVPLLVGWNSEEMNYRALMGSEKPTRENFSKVVQRLYGDRATEISKLYNPTTDEEVEQVATDLAGDRFISYSTWKWADLQVRTGGGVPVYRYIFSRPRPAMNAAMGNAAPGLAGGVVKSSDAAAPKMPLSKGAVHSAEIEYAMGNLATNKVYAWTPEDYKVSKIMQEYFANFIKTGDPNGAGLPAWSAVTPGSAVSIMNIDVDTKAEAEKYRERYMLLDQFSNR